MTSLTTPGYLISKESDSSGLHHDILKSVYLYFWLGTIILMISPIHNEFEYSCRNLETIKNNVDYKFRVVFLYYNSDGPIFICSCIQIFISSFIIKDFLNRQTFLLIFMFSIL